MINIFLSLFSRKLNELDPIATFRFSSEQRGIKTARNTRSPRFSLFNA